MASWRLVVGFILSSLGVFYSFSSFVFFFFGNYHAAFWALIAGILAAIDCHLLFLHWRKTLVSWHCNETIYDIEILAVLGLVSGLAFAVWYIFLFLYENLPILPVDTSYQIAAVSAFFTAKCGLGLMFTTRHLASDLLQNHADSMPSPSYYRCSNYYRRIAQ